MSKRLLIVIAVVLAVAGFYFRYLNGQEATRRAAAVVAADTAGQDTKAAVADLKAYLGGHMGAQVEVTLATSYAQAQAAAKASAAAQAANSQIYVDAQRVCGGKSDSITQAKCNQDYISKHLANVPLPTPVAEPKAADYQLALRAPLWTPDFAGASFLGAIAAVGLLLWASRRPGVRHG